MPNVTTYLLVWVKGLALKLICDLRFPESTMVRAKHQKCFLRKQRTCSSWMNPRHSCGNELSVNLELSKPCLTVINSIYFSLYMYSVPISCTSNFKYCYPHMFVMSSFHYIKLYKGTHYNGCLNSYFIFYMTIGVFFGLC